MAAVCAMFFVGIVMAGAYCFINGIGFFQTIEQPKLIIKLPLSDYGEIT